MSDPPAYDVVVVGGGPAGLTTAMYTTRLGHRTAVIEKGGGRHSRVAHVHNLFGVSEDVNGSDLAAHAVEQLQVYGGTYYPTTVESVRRAGERDATGGDDTAGEDDHRFVVETDGTTVEAARVVFATGFVDVPPAVPGIRRFTGRGLHYCLHCDAYSLGDGPTFVLGHDDHAVHVAMVMLNVTDDVDLLLDGQEPDWSDETARQLRAHPVERVDAPVTGAYERDGDGEGDEAVGDGTVEDDGRPWLGGLRFEDGTERAYLGGFAMYGREYNTELAVDLGCGLEDDGALAVDATQETSVTGAYGVGDVTHGGNQTAIALGDGARAGVAIHKDLRRYPVPADELAEGESIDPADVPAAPADLRARMRLARGRESFPGLREPPPTL